MTQRFIARLSALVAIAGALAMGPKQASAELPCMGLMEAWFWAGNGECPTGESVCAQAFPSCGEPTSGGCTANSGWAYQGTMTPGTEGAPSGAQWAGYIACYYGQA